jgi:DNA (cytosine-5)-methyltransferase 1
VEKPVSTIVGRGTQQQVVAAHLINIKKNCGPQDVGDILPTITTKSHVAQVSAGLVKLRGTGTANTVEEPVHTISAQGTHFAEIRAFLIKYYGNEADGHGLDSPLGTVTTRDRFGLVTVTIDGTEYAIVDIGMRMLAPHELFAAQGFPADYVIVPEINGKPMTKTAQIARCGNAVCPPLPKALISANWPQMAEAVAA